MYVSHISNQSHWMIQSWTFRKLWLLQLFCGFITTLISVVNLLFRSFKDCDHCGSFFPLVCHRVCVPVYVHVCILMSLFSCIYPHIMNTAIPLEPVANAYQTLWQQESPLKYSSVFPSCACVQCISQFLTALESWRGLFVHRICSEFNKFTVLRVAFVSIRQSFFPSQWSGC